ncbi:MAG: ACT domain-containing protein [Oscillospiraceae bacterium]
MSKEKHSRFYLVDGDALPEVFIRVTEAKELLDTGCVQTVAEAAAQVGISRSAYYKYKDSVIPFQDLGRGRIVTFQIMLRHQMGVLSAMLGLLAETGANILTINQGIPTDGTAPVTITADTADMDITTEELLERIEGIEGVIRAAVAAG